MSEAKDYLLKIKYLDERIKAKIGEIDDLYDLVTHITPYIKENPGTSNGGNQDKLGTAVSKIVDLQNEINRDIDYLVDLKHEITAKLEKLENPDYYKVLHLRYIRNFTFEKIATEMNYSYRGVCYLLGRSLNVFEKIMNEW